MINNDYYVLVREFITILFKGKKSILETSNSPEISKNNASYDLKMTHKNLPTELRIRRGLPQT